jgi:hypothetical protein
MKSDGPSGVRALESTERAAAAARQAHPPSRRQAPSQTTQQEVAFNEFLRGPSPSETFRLDSTRLDSPAVPSLAAVLHPPTGDAASTHRPHEAFGSGSVPGPPDAREVARRLLEQLAAHLAPPVELSEEALLAAIRHALPTLPPRHARMIQYLMEGRSFAETAEVMGLTDRSMSFRGRRVATQQVEQDTHRAIQALRQALQHELGNRAEF